jgi:elongation factor P
MVLASQLREGMALRIEGQIYKVLGCEVKAGAGQQGGVVRARLRNAASGRLLEPHLRPDERLEELELDRQTMEFLYADADSCVFMNPETFEQIEVPRTIIGTMEKFLREGTRVPVEFFEGRFISIVLPDAAELRITETAPPAHAGQDTTWKQARLENGLDIQVPLFIAPGEMVRVDTRTGRYLERVRTEKKKIA